MTRKRSHSSTLWLQRRKKDPFVQKARQEGWRARSAFKLIEIQKKHVLFKKKSTVLDLGAAPGGWSEVVASFVSEGRIVAVDRLAMDPLSGVTIVQADLEDHNVQQIILEALEHKAHVVLSDAAPNTIGHPATDHLRMMALLERIWLCAQNLLHEGGSFVCKGWKGSEWSAFVKAQRTVFRTVHVMKPQSSQKESREEYLICKGFLPKMLT